jgi:sterol desaturase/sphingolipid hydroxylase (fatty acid hydroxylase superfamily)
VQDPDSIARLLATDLRAEPPGPSLGRRAVEELFVFVFLGLCLVPWVAAPAARASATSAVLLLAMLLVFLVEQVVPGNPEWNARPLATGLTGWKQLGRDLVYFFGVAQLSAWAITAVDPKLSAAMAQVGAAGALSVWPSSAPFALKAALAFFALEFCDYWIHRAAHRSKLLWQFHSTHHAATAMNGLKAVRTHPVDNLLFYVGRTIPLLLVGAGAEELVAATYLGGMLGILSHANLRLADRGVGLVVNLPQFHASHHSAELAESNSNFGCHTVLWDRVFRTFRGTPKLPVTLGIVPVRSRSLWEELAWPFFRRVS